MTQDSETTHADLAFLKALVTEGPKAQETAGQVFVVAGAAYGIQALLYWAQITFSLSWPPLLFLAVGFAPVVIIVALIVWLVWTHRKPGQQGVATRALNAAFISAGLANLAMCLVFGYVASSEKNFLIWLLYPAVA